MQATAQRQTIRIIPKAEKSVATFLYYGVGERKQIAGFKSGGAYWMEEKTKAVSFPKANKSRAR